MEEQAKPRKRLHLFKSNIVMKTSYAPHVAFGCAHVAMSGGDHLSASRDVVYVGGARVLARMSNVCVFVFVDCIRTYSITSSTSSCGLTQSYCS
jgi:hypothetical protein